MSHFFELVNGVASGGANVMIDAGIKAAVVLFIAWRTVRSLNRASAAVRHRVWSLGLSGALLMPILSLTVPQLRLAVLPATAKPVERTPLAAARAADDSLAADKNSQHERNMASENKTSLAAGTPVDRRTPLHAIDQHSERPQETALAMAAPPDTHPSAELSAASESNPAQSFHAYLFGVWIAGLFVMSSPLVAGFGMNWFLLRKARRLKNRRWGRLVATLSARIGLTRAVTAFESPQPVVPMTWGFLRPAVLVPSTWRDWSEERKRCVLLHELAHVKRLDVVFQMIGRLAVGCHWFNPLAWYALRQLRVERELACDDCVLASGERASDYARELLQIARLYRPQRLAIGVAMAQSARLDQRVVGILDHARSRLPVSPKLTRCLILVSTTLVFAVAATRLVEKTSAAVANENPITASAKTAGTNPGDAKAASGDTVTVTGVVVTPDGKPVAGARVFAHETDGSSSKIGSEKVHTLADAIAASDGTFKLQFEKPKITDQRGINQWVRRRHGTQFVAMADGYAIGFASQELPGRWNNFQLRSNEPVRIQLAPQEPLTGRLVDLEGRPLANVKVEVKAVVEAGEQLDEWFKSAAKNPRPVEKFQYFASMQAPGTPPVRFPSKNGIAATGVMPTVQTDNQGRFSIPGIGRDRLVALEVTSPMIVKSMIKMVSHRGPDVFDVSPDPRLRDSMIHGQDATIALEPAITIRGQIVDAGTGEPIPGCKLEVTQVAGSIMSVEDFAITTTDDSGRYVLGQLPPDPPNSRGYTIRVKPPAGAPYFATDYTVRIGGDVREKSFDIRLRQARLITGRITDQSGQGVRALVGFLPTRDNKSAADFANFRANMHTMAYDDFCWNEADGSFRVPAIHGRGVLCVVAEHMAAYKIAGNADRIEGLQHEGDDFGLYHLMGPAMANEFREVKLAEGDPDLRIDVALHALDRRTIRLIDTDGKPVIGCLATGQLPDAMLAARQSLSFDPPLETAETEVVGLEVESPRVVAFHHPTRNIGATIVLRDGEQQKEPVTVTLRPCGQIRGRVLDKSGQGVTAGQVSGRGLSPVELPKSKYNFRPASFGVYAQPAKVQSDGHFVIEKVLPGIRYQLTFVGGQFPTERPAREKAPPEPTTTETSAVEPGQTIELGDLTIGDWNSQNSRALVSLRSADDAKPESDGQADPSQSASSDKVAPITVQGRVLDTDGKAVAKAKLHIIPEFPHLVAEPRRASRLVATTNDSGEFEFASGGDQAEQRPNDQIVITADGYGPEWLPLSEAIERRTINVSLPEDRPVEGRILTLEGQPVAGAKINVTSIRAMNNGDLTSYIETVKAGNGSNFRFDKYIFGPPQVISATTDQDGRFRLTGVGQNRVVELELVGRAIQHVRLRVMTLDSEPIRARAGRGFAEMEREMGTPPVFGASFEWLARPSRPIIGKVLDAKTGQPLKGVSVGSLDEAQATTDENGRFELIGCAKAKEYRLLMSTDDQPYIFASKRVADTPGLEPLEVALEMTQGIKIAGRVTDAATGKPVTARVVYYPLHPNENIVPGIGGSEANAMGAFCERATDKNGEFSIAVLPGPGFIGLMAHDRDSFQVANVDLAAFYKKEKVPYAAETRGAERSLVIAGGDGSRSFMPQTNFHFIELLNLPPNKEDATPREIQLRASHKVAGIVLDPDGKPIEGTNAYGLVDERYSLKAVNGSQFSVTGLGDGEKRQLLFRHQKRRLVGVAEVTANTPQPIQITLQPWGEVSGRLVDPEGQPLSNLEIGTLARAEEGEVLGYLPRLRATDDQGRFHIDGLVPGLTYAIQPRSLDKPHLRILTKAGEKLEVGDVSSTFDSAAQRPAKP